MNNIQKIFVLIGVSGLFVFIKVSKYDVIGMFGVLICCVGLFLYKDK